MLAPLLYAFFGGYALFLLGFAVFMYRENRKFGDNQFVMKLLPPPPRLERPAEPSAAAVSGDWTAVPAPSEAARAPAPQPPAFRTLASLAR